MTIDELRRKINNDYYNSELPYGTREERAAYREDQGRLSGEFKRDLLAALELTNHPKAELFYQKCWDTGHASGFSEVLIVAEDWVEIIKE